MANSPRTALLSLAALVLLLPSSAMAQDRDRAILRTMERVANWELAHPNEIAYPTKRTIPKHALDWLVATFYTGLTELADRSADRRYADAIYAAGERYHWALGPRPFEANDYEPAQNWIWAYRHKHDPRMIAAVRDRFNAIIAANPQDSLLMASAPDDVSGCFRRWCWSDALFMGPPGWVALAQVTGDKRYQAYADKQYAATTALLFDPAVRLYYRDSSYFGKRGAHGERIFWSRGNGWVYAGLARILTSLPANSPSRPFYQKLFLQMSRALLPLQKADGSWPPSLLDPRPDTAPETSGTAFFTFGLAWGINHGLLKGTQWRRAAMRGWEALTRAVDDSGKLGWVQQVNSEPGVVSADHTQPYGVGAFLLAGAAMMDLARQEARNEKVPRLARGSDLCSMSGKFEERTGTGPSRAKCAKHEPAEAVQTRKKLKK